MEVMYLKYVHGTRHSIIKEGENIIMNDSKLIPFKHEEKVVTKSTLPFNSKVISTMSICNDDINEEITNFFFDVIHKNYLLSRKK